MVATVGNSWQRIDDWLRRNGLPTHFALPPGVHESAIRAVEVELRAVLPADVRESYLLHDGSGPHGAHIYLTDMFLVLPLVEGYDSAVSRRSRLLELAAHETDSVGRPTGPIKPDWWNPRWLPVGSDENGNLLCIDFDPAAGGTVGQVIECQYTAETRVVARSWAEWLAALADSMEAGAYRLAGHQHAVWLADPSGPHSDEED